MKTKLEKINCDFCGSDLLTLFAEQKDLIHKVDNSIYRVVRCNNCGLKFTNPRPIKESISTFYSNNYSFHSNKFRLSLFIKILLEWVAWSALITKLSFLLPKKINQILINFLKPRINDPVLEYLNSKKNLIDDLSFLDIGCGSGLSANFWGSKSSLNKLSKKFINTFGVEPSISARKILQKNKISSYGDIEEINHKHKFHVIRLNWSLEHVHSPSRYFSFINSHLTKDGIAVICVPNTDGILYRINPSALELPVHLFHFDFNSLVNYAEKFNLKVINQLTFSYPGMYLFAEKIGLISKKHNFSNMNLSAAHNLLKFHKIIDDVGLGNDLLVTLKKK